jgi:hypothetical protein
MAAIIKRPPRIHTAFNPVLLQLAAASQTERDGGIACILTSGARSSAVRREFFNDLAQFDLSGVLKYWFTEETVVLPQSGYCFLDRRLAFEYHIDLSDSDSTAVNAVVQIGRNPDMTAWGDRFLTNMPALRKYEGYPLDVSFLNTNGGAVVNFEGDAPPDESGFIRDLHFCISIPDGVTSIAVSPWHVLVSNSGAPIRTNQSDDIVVRGGAPVRLRGGVVSSCIPANPCYLRWINTLGGFDYRMFSLSQTYTLSVKAQTVVSPVIDDVLNAGLTDRETDAEADRTVFAGAGNLTGAEYDELLHIATSPRVEMWDAEVRKWFRVYVASGDFEHSTRDTVKEIELELTLPALQMQF